MGRQMIRWFDAAEVQAIGDRRVVITVYWNGSRRGSEILTCTRPIAEKLSKSLQAALTRPPPPFPITGDDGNGPTAQ